MNKDNSIEYILRFLSGDMSESERIAFLKWVESAENKRLYHRLKNLWVAKNIVDSDSPANIDSLYHSFKKATFGKRLRLKSVFQTIQRVAAILLIPILGLWVWQLLSSPRKPQEVKAQISYTYYTPLGVKGVVMLPDSTQVWLNSGSTLRFPKEFTGNTRSVSLSGEAYFNVAKDEYHPFIVELPLNTELRVYGTQFNVSCYPGENIIQTTLVEGSLGLQSNMLEKELKLKPNENLRIDFGKGSYKQRRVDVELYTSWKDGRLILQNTPAAEAFQKLERWFNVKFVIADKEIETFHFTATFDRENVAQVMDLLRLSSPIEYTITKESVFIKKQQPMK